MRRVVLWLLGWYQQYSELRPPSCRFQPTCSAYTRQAVETFGPVRGLLMGGRRILRCHPWGGHGHDPVPDPAPVPIATDAVPPPLSATHA